MKYVFGALLGDGSTLHRDSLCKISPFKSIANTLKKQYVCFRPRNNRIPIQTQQKQTVFELQASKVTFNRCLNTINRLCAQDKVPPDPFHQYLDFDPAHRGVTGVIWGQIGPKTTFLAMQPILVSLNRCLNTINRLCAQDRVPSDTFHQFLDFDLAHRGGHGGHLAF